jgi:hypothetical protein
MRLTRKGKEGRFYFVVEQTPGEVPGGEVEICVYSSHEGEGILELRRTLYFDEQSPQHIDNFFKEFSYDDHYREICLRGTAHWLRVARLYQLNAGIIVKEEKVPEKDIYKTCQVLFHFIRRDIGRIENHSEYKREMARISKGEEEALNDTLALLGKVPNIEISSACQGSSGLQLGDREIFIPSCHTELATLTFTSLPTSFLHYLQSGPLGQRHIARLEPTLISSTQVSRNRLFIQLLTTAISAYLQKYRFR